MKDTAQDGAQDVLGAAEDGSVKVVILPVVIFHRVTREEQAREGRGRRCGAGRGGGRAGRRE